MSDGPVGRAAERGLAGLPQQVSAGRSHVCPGRAREPSTTDVVAAQCSRSKSSETKKSPSLGA